MLPQIYKVGGCVRDEILGKPPTDTDFVAIGFSADDFYLMGYKQIGKDFPVFLSPQGHEYALARKERSTGHAYNNFIVSTKNVTIEEDLSRRDLTINSIAKAHDGSYIDPYGGISDIKNKILRHTSEAFKEDPVRVLRLARFRTQFGYDWKIHPSTKLLVYSMKESLKYLQPDRVYKEVDKIMNLSTSYLFFTTLDSLNVLDVIFPSIYSLKTYREDSIWHEEPNVFEHTISMLKHAQHEPSIIKYMILYHDICKPICYTNYGSGIGHDTSELAEPLIDIKLPTKIKKYVLFHIQNHQRLRKVETNMSASKIVKFIKSFRKDKKLLEACIKVDFYDTLGSISNCQKSFTMQQELIEAFDKISSYSPLPWIQSQVTPPNQEQIKQHIHRYNLSVVNTYIISKRHLT